MTDAIRSRNEIIYILIHPGISNVVCENAPFFEFYTFFPPAFPFERRVREQVFLSSNRFVEGPRLNKNDVETAGEQFVDSSGSPLDGGTTPHRKYRAVY